jgi:ribosomal peptide maturation radical SAM protein 1
MGMELHRRFNFVDYALMGEADESFPVLVRLLLAGRLKGAARNAIPGLLYRSKTGTQCTSPPQPVRDMDELPIPDYSDYFRDLDLSAAGLFVVPTLLFETSRGCWWGARHHCRFCGLNGTTLSFRSKTAKRALEEVKYLVSQWQIDMLQAVDNVVNMAHFRDLFPALAHNERPLRFFYEIRANLSRKQVKILRDAGVVHVQPGIESMNQHILDLMGKGTTPFLNIQVLKWCKEYDIHADWNLLYGFPGETEADYKQLLRLLPEIRFLNPPRACGPVRLDRFSPYFMSASRYGFTNVRPLASYHYIYPFDDESVHRIAYYFDYDYAPGCRTGDRSAELIGYVNDWRTNPERGTLQAVERPDGTLAIIDTRSIAIRRDAVLRGMDQEAYSYCDVARSAADVHRQLLRKFPGAKVSEVHVRAFLEGLVAHRFMVTDDSLYLSLALRSQPEKEISRAETSQTSQEKAQFMES